MEDRDKDHARKLSLPEVARNGSVGPVRIESAILLTADLQAETSYFPLFSSVDEAQDLQCLRFFRQMSAMI